jgi:effector-binding domain-containing protein
MSSVTTEPKIDERKEQHTIGIRTLTATNKLSVIIPKLLKEMRKWMDTKGVKPSGVPFLRFYVIDMAVEYDIEVGFPVATRVAGDDHVTANVIPAGRYASLIYIGKNRGYQGSKTLVEWARDNGIKWDRWDDPKGDAFRCRYESFLTNPAEEPDTKKWQTEVAIKLTDH